MRIPHYICSYIFCFILKHRSVFYLPQEVPLKLPNRISILLRVMNSVLEVFWMLLCTSLLKRQSSKLFPGKWMRWLMSQIASNQCRHSGNAASRFPLLRLACRAGKVGQGVRLLFWEQHGLKSAIAPHSCLAAFRWNKGKFHLYQLTYESVSFLKQYPKTWEINSLIFGPWLLYLYFIEKIKSCGSPVCFWQQSSVQRAGDLILHNI